MQLVMVDDDGATVQEYGAVTGNLDGTELDGDVLTVRIPGEGDGASTPSAPDNRPRGDGLAGGM